MNENFESPTGRLVVLDEMKHMADPELIARIAKMLRNL